MLRHWERNDLIINNCDLIIKKLNEISEACVVLKDEPMKNHTSFQIGGPASVMFVPDSTDSLIKALSVLEGVPHTVIGNGTNLLVSDNGYDGVVIKIAGNLSDVIVNGDEIVAGAGAKLSKIGNEAKLHSLCGFEFACGIPGTVGGAVFMNAGAYDGEMKDVVAESYYVDYSGNTGVIREHNFGYRTSCYKDSNKIITGVKIKLKKGNSAEIAEKMLDFAKRRSDKQPLEYPSAGSTFKRPEGYFAGKLIQDAGLKGYTVGGAKVSEKHSGFIINDNNATCKDVLDLIEHIKKTVFEKFGVMLTEEVRVL